MKHRGRHRRRKRGQALRAVLAGAALALTAAATLISTSQAGVADRPGALEPLTSPAATAELRLQERLVPPRTLNRLARAMGRPVGVDAVLKSADRTLRPGAGCTSADHESLPVTPEAERAYCWDPADTATEDWRPASVTTSGDADDDGLWGADRVILAGWSHSTTSGPTADRGLARVAFVDAADPVRPVYRWVLLVVPTEGGRDYRGLVSQVSGMAWYQDKLLVTTTAGDTNALYVYDLHRIQRTTVAAAAVGRVPGGWSAGGYGYAMPAVGAYRFSAGPCTTTRSPCPAGISLDRSTSPDSLVLGEWTPADSDRHARLWRYSFSSAPSRGGLLATDVRGQVSAVEAYETRANGIRGVLSHRPPGADRSEWYVGHLPRTPDGHGCMWRQTTSGTRAARCGADATHRCWGEGAGSLSYWQGTGEVWSVTDRMLFSVPLPSIDRSLG
ncbi:hypothetical protein [Streptomyces brasiliensis]|uniref:Secreted protein n=1 Tax=Streptomyces brasiliensis TaxID=1954 RepID=A0A917KRY8_9ACTN|nr:hypothetical protein [Streptomyces brasiliensis]GGJ21678.1 hypothetical protein GCM10010121_035850 [Streptomyces brasiliensis]